MEARLYKDIFIHSEVIIDALYSLYQIDVNQGQGVWTYQQYNLKEQDGVTQHEITLILPHIEIRMMSELLLLFSFRFRCAI